jgi:hypothetical protein
MNVFDLNKFLKELAKSKALSGRQQAEISRAVKSACNDSGGSSIEGQVRPGDVFVSTRGVRLVVEVTPRKYALVSLKCFKDDCGERAGAIVAGTGKAGGCDLAELKERMEKCAYRRSGRIEEIIEGVPWSEDFEDLEDFMDGLGDCPF